MTLEISTVTVRYGSLTAVDDVSLNVGGVDGGEIVALLGESGSGKSTLLRAVAGLEPLASGTISFDSQRIDSTPVHKRGFALMFQDGQLFAHRDVAGNVGYALPKEMSKQERQQRISELLDLVGLSGYQKRSISTLSGGQAQRVALARALAASPRLLLLDEPLSALDRTLREYLTVELRKIIHDAGISAVYVTHDHDEAFTVADRVGVMVDGRLERLGTPREVWAEPGSEAVEKFLSFGPFLDAVRWRLECRAG
ncbi:MAG: ABC transporter ATP-binding protein [Buchananella hordeovulneris]|nr:ABC transporter ATP-binding protein [Buchananella hordeovulneris]